MYVCVRACVCFSVAFSMRRYESSRELTSKLSDQFYLTIISVYIRSVYRLRLTKDYS